MKRAPNRPRLDDVRGSDTMVATEDGPWRGPGTDEWIARIDAGTRRPLLSEVAPATPELGELVVKEDATDYAALNLLDGIAHESGTNVLQGYEAGMRLAIADPEVAVRLLAALDQGGTSEVDLDLEIRAMRHDLAMEQALARSLWERHEKETEAPARVQRRALVDMLENLFGPARRGAERAQEEAGKAAEADAAAGYAADRAAENGADADAHREVPVEA